MVKKHVLFIVENNSVPQDNRVWNEAQAVRDIGYEVSVICPRDGKASEKYVNLNGINIYRHFNPLEANNKLSFIFEYGNALMWELILSFKIYFLIKRFHYIHSANPPDHIFIIAFIFKLFNVKFIFDHHDICPENYLAKFDRKDIFYKAMLLMERASFKLADIVISTNESYREIAIDRGANPEERVFVVRNGPNLEEVIYKEPNDKWKDGLEYLVCYVGAIGNQEGLENLLEAAKILLRDKSISNIKFVIIGKGPHLEKLKKIAEEYELTRYVTFTEYVPYEQFYEILATADICVNPEHRNSFTERSTMLKIMDYMTFGKPIVMFETIEGKVTAGKAAVYIKENDNYLLADSILDLLEDTDKRQKMGVIGRKRIEDKLSWNIQKTNLQKAYMFLEEYG